MLFDLTECLHSQSGSRIRLALPLAQGDALRRHQVRELGRHPLALHVRRFHDRPQRLHIPVLQHHLRRLRVLLEPRNGPRARDGDKVGVLGEDPRERELRRRGAVLPSDRAEPVDDLEVLGEVLVREAGQQLAQVVLLEVGPRLESAISGQFVRLYLNEQFRTLTAR